MWNRVLLLATGVACGWTLVHCWSAPLEQRIVHRVRLLLGLSLGLALAVLLAAANWAAGLAAILVFALSGLVAYAANARQISKVPDPWPARRPVLPVARDPRTAIILCADGEPATYDGPRFWAPALGASREAGARIPHWFVRPRAYARIRAAYAAMGDLHPLARALEEASAELAQRLGPQYEVRRAYLEASPRLQDVLLQSAEAGLRRVVVVPLARDADIISAARDQVTASRVRELGIQVVYAADPGDLPGGKRLYGRHLAELAAGRPIAAGGQVTQDAIEAVVESVLRATTQPDNSP